MTAPARRLTLVMPAATLAMSFRERIATGSMINVLIARIGRERFALDMGDVLEAVDATDLHQVPQLGVGALGVVTWRSAAHTVWSPARALRAKVDRPDTALFLRSPTAPVAVAVDDVEDLLTLRGGDVRRLPGVNDGGGLVLGALHIGDTLATVLDAGVLAGAVRGGGSRES